MSLREALDKRNLFCSPNDRLKRRRALKFLADRVAQWMELEQNGNCLDGIRHMLTVGSFRLCVDFKSSDIDVLVRIPRCVKGQYAYRLANLLQSNNRVVYAKVIDNIRHSILIKTCIDGIQFDIAPICGDRNFTSMCLRVNSIDEYPFSWYESSNLRLLRDFIYSKPEFLTALKAIRLWARRKGIYSNALRYLNGISLAILTGRICQWYPCASAEKILYHFFRIYSAWDWRRPVNLRSDVLVSILLSVE